MVCVDDGRELTVPVLLDGEESIMEFIDLPYSGVCIRIHSHCCTGSLHKRHIYDVPQLYRLIFNLNWLIFIVAAQ